MIRVAVTSLRGGAGVTALVSAMAQAGAAEGLEVVCIDADDQGLLRHHLGLVSMSDDGGSRNGDARIAMRAGQDWKIADAADLVLFDLPRARPDISADVFAGADAVVLVLPAAASSVAIAPAVKAFLAAGENRFLLINFDNGRIALKRAAAAYLEDQFAERVIGRIRHDEALEEVIAGLDTLSSAAPFSAAWADIRVAFVRLLERMNNLPVPAMAPK